MKNWDASRIGIFDVNFATGEQYWSLELRHILRVADDTPAEFHLLLQHVHPDDRRAVLAFAMEQLRPHYPRQCTLEHRLQDGDGTVRWVHVEAARAYRSPSEDDLVRLIGLVIEIARPKTNAVVQQRSASFV